MDEQLYEHDSEVAVLGVLANISALDINKALVQLDQSKLSEDCFHLPANRILFVVCESLLKSGKPLDPLSIKAELERTKGSMVVQWNHVCDVVMGQTHLPDSSLHSHAQTLRDLAARRSILGELRKAAGAVVQRNVDPHETASKLSSRLIELSAISSKVGTLNDLLEGILVHIENVFEGKKTPVVRTCIPELDRIIGGWQPTLNMVGALPGVGKSALFASTIHGIAEFGTKVAMFSLEDEASWIGWRLLSKESGMSQHKMRFERIAEHQFETLEKGFTKLHRYAQNIYLVDGSERGMTPDEIVRSATDLIINHGVRIIFIDHLGEIRMPGESDRHDLEISDCLSRLRGVANRFGIPVVVAAHLRRREGLGQGDEPRLSDFANSSGAERKARVALGLYRQPDSDTLGISVLKNTNGKAGYKCEVTFTGASAMIATTEGRYNHG